MEIIISASRFSGASNLSAQLNLPVICTSMINTEGQEKYTSTLKEATKIHFTNRRNNRHQLLDAFVADGIWLVEYDMLTDYLAAHACNKSSWWMIHEWSKARGSFFKEHWYEDYINEDNDYQQISNLDEVYNWMDQIGVE